MFDGTIKKIMCTKAHFPIDSYVYVCYNAIIT